MSAVSVSAVPESSWGGRPTLRWGSTVPGAGGCRLDTKRKGKEPEDASTHSSLLPVWSQLPPPLLATITSLPWGTAPTNCEPKQSLSCLVLCQVFRHSSRESSTGDTASPGTRATLVPLTGATQPSLSPASVCLMEPSPCPWLGGTSRVTMRL